MPESSAAAAISRMSNLPLMFPPEKTSKIITLFLITLRHYCQFLTVLGIHCFRAAAGGLKRQIARGSKVMQRWIRIRQKTRDHPLRPVDLFHNIARIRRYELVLVQLIIRTTNKGFTQIHGIVDDRDHGQPIAVSNPMLGNRGEVTPRHPVAADVTFLEMRDGDRQHVAFPLCRGKTGPGVGGVRRWMRAAVEVVDVVDRTQPLGMKGCDLARYRVYFFPDVQVGRSTSDVIGGMRPALPLGKRLDGCIPCIGSHSCRVSDR